MMFNIQDSKTALRATVRVSLHTGDHLQDLMDQIFDLLNCDADDDFDAEIIEVNGTCEFTLKLNG